MTSQDPFAIMAAVELADYCTPECVHSEGEEPCGPPLIAPLTGFDIYLINRYG